MSLFMPIKLHEMAVFSPCRTRLQALLKQSLLHKALHVGAFLMTRRPDDPIASTTDPAESHRSFNSLKPTAGAFSWDQRIARAQKLSKNDSPAHEILELYSKTASLQKQINLSLKGTEHPEVHVLLKFLPQLRTLVKDLGSPHLQAATIELGDNQERWSEVLLNHWEQHPQAQDSAHAFLAHLLLQPYAEHVTCRMNLGSDNSSPVCPACSNPPQLSLLREFSNGAKRSLVCSLCSAEWDFRRVLCPYCGEQHKDKLPVFTAEEFSQARIEGCDTCKAYIKCIDLSKDGYAVPQVDDLATLALDLWAQEQGYTRRQPNIFMLSLPEPTELPET